jgi:soluble lytic murein transglycosylase-like protein
MKHLLTSAWLAALATLPYGADAQAQQRAQYDALVAAHAQANGVPEALVHRVIVRESRYQPGLVGRGGTIGLMQIKLATARGLGYTGTAEGPAIPKPISSRGVKYLAGAYRVAGSDYSRAMHYYASGYYYAAKRQRLAFGRHGQPRAIAPQFGAAPVGGGNKPCRRLRAAGSRQIEGAAGLRVDSSGHRLTLTAFRGELRGGAEIPLTAVTL